MAFLVLRGALDGRTGDARWVYGAGVIAVGACLLTWRRDYGELAAQTRPDLREALLGIGVGLAVFVAWILLDAPWMLIGEPTAGYVPLHADGSLDLPLIAARWIGAALLVPVMEELFWRSFLMRWIADARFETVDPRRAGVRAVVLSTFVFVLAHTMWLAAIVAGLAYALLYMRIGKLWVAVIAHAVTNGALGLWVVATRQWQFW